MRVYGLLDNCRDYGLRDQMTRAAVSIASNIAEGAERDSMPDFIRFLNIAKGFAAQRRTQLYIAQRIGIFGHTTQTELTDELKQISAMLEGMRKSLKNQNLKRNT